ncbi:tail fiber domain-containing protein [Formosa maritima]|uniref:Peptidase S74 domain-containing protein n=1 Tax=Formosa maritima TaxID=2592046 RepID=A0A5D0GKE3_9FLAO|nr:tail fiber domain-containing protein [Formosa maritima]TYA59316.1 hypothetical protein FVF61_01505 [Formosa maritima]
MGYGTLADDFNSLVVGAFNENSTSSTTLFQVGNGTDINDRSNAFVVEREGMIIAPSLDITEITNPKALITKEYLDANTSEASGLEAIDEGNGGSGWRFIGRDSNNYGNIGSNAVDLSISEFASEVYGATGNRSFASGYNTTASGQSSTSMGYFSVASGTRSTALGRSTIASGESSTALGTSTEANNTFSTAMGRQTLASGENATSMGYLSTASGDFLTAIGINASASGDSNIASGNTSVALGIITQASGDYSLAMGNNVQVSSFAASALGYNLINDDSYATVVGQNNDNTTTSSALFQVGNGVSTANRTNAFTVFRNGNATLAGTLTQSSDRRLKTNISELPYGLKEILQMKPVNYNWKRYPEQQKSLGLIAQEVQPIINEIVHIAEDKDNTLSISYSELIPVLIKAIQEQQAIIESQKQTIQNQEQASTEQSALLQALLNRVEALEKQATPSDIKLVKN